MAKAYELGLCESLSFDKEEIIWYNKIYMQYRTFTYDVTSSVMK